MTHYKIPLLENVNIAIQLNLCPWCGNTPVQAKTGERRRCRNCHARWSITPYGGLHPEPGPYTQLPTGITLLTKVSTGETTT